jgi:hypothetical protein
MMVAVSNSLRKQAVAWLTGAMPWGSKEPELEKKQSRRVFVYSKSHADDLEEVLLHFGVAYHRLWNVMTDIKHRPHAVSGSPVQRS